MKALKLENPMKIYLIPRIFPSISDNISLYLRNEMSNEILTPNFTFEIGQKMIITINEALDYFKESQKLSIEVKNNDDIIYLGKLITLKAGVDPQNYEYKDQTSKRFDFK